jgi:putative membrane protein
MVSWDVGMDPYQSTISGDWIWEQGGPYFGVPLHNYVGWFCTVATFVLLYLLYEQLDPLPPLSGPAASRFFWGEPAIFYALIGVGIVITPLVNAIHGPIASPNNYSGSLDNLMQSLSLVATFVMGTPVALTLVRLLHHPVTAEAA